MKLDDLKARLLHCSENTKDEYLHELTGKSLTAITDLEALVGELGEALRPFADIRTQFPESMKLIQKNVDGMKPITITVTKAQMQTAVATLAKLEKARGKDQDHD